MTPALPTRYTLTGIGSNGCISEKSVMVTFRDLPDVQIKGDKTVCLDSMATLVVSGAKDYYWSHGKYEAKIVETKYNDKEEPFAIVEYLQPNAPEKNVFSIKKDIGNLLFFDYDIAVVSSLS